MTVSMILAFVFDLFALAALLYTILGKSVLKHIEFRKYLTGVAGVYLSGTVFITVVVCVAKDIPLLFTIISEISVVFMFVMSYVTVIRLTNNLEAIRAEIKEKARVNENESQND